MATLGGLKEQIASDLHRSDLTTQIALAIAESVAEYQGRRFAFNQARDSFATVAATEYYGSGVIPADIAEIDSLKLTYSGTTYTLEPVSFGWIEDVSSTTNTGRPTRWAWYAQEIRLYPIPDAAYTVSIAYLQKIDVPSSDGESNAWTTTAKELIRHASVKRLCRDTLQDYQRAEFAQAAEERQWRVLLRESHKLDSGRLGGCM